MKAVTCINRELQVEDVETPQPGQGQALLEVTRCGICGSDIHARQHCDELAEVMSEIGYPDFMRSDQRVVFGHEFAGRVAEYGPGSRKQVPVGADVVALPLVRRRDQVHAVGLSAAAPGAYAEHVLVEESMMLPVPNGLGPDLSALTEPMAVGWHAVRRSEIGKRYVAIVIGCGPIGLAVICALKASGVRTVVASDFSAARRQLAMACGADVAVDPSSQSPYDAADRDHLKTLPAAVELAISTMEKLQRLPVPWQHVWRAVDALGIKPKSPVIFECVGVPGIIDGIVASAPLFSRVIVVGVCMGNDTLRPSMAINKEIDLRFVVGYTPLEFRDTLHMRRGQDQRRRDGHRSRRTAGSRSSIRRTRRRRAARENPHRPQQRRSPTRHLSLPVGPRHPADELRHTPVDSAPDDRSHAGIPPRLVRRVGHQVGPCAHVRRCTPGIAKARAGLPTGEALPFPAAGLANRFRFGLDPATTACYLEDCAPQDRVGDGEATQRWHAPKRESTREVW